ncbi:hypothetical protein PJF56_16950 [Roseofilum sp. BLCC_M91]|uniref:Uncharacterized protein n=1 Tax=Roseofilum halophilum BLCC-M91 TaxID=3022259 RepID=A0ABT7BN10_9CYAN|nr:hypothetical protein [Roseofilum halophilum]MDJ1180550.1 hypothetical protein [Roseofilum halophilum BLCC-M91]
MPRSSYQCFVEDGGDYRLPITDYRLPITHYPLPITDYPLPITHCYAVRSSLVDV